MCNALLLAQVARMSAEDVLRLEQILFGGLFLVVLLLVLCVMPILIWRGRLRRQGYPSLLAYFRELPTTSAGKAERPRYDPERCGSLPPGPALSADHLFSAWSRSILVFGSWRR